MTSLWTRSLLATVLCSGLSAQTGPIPAFLAAPGAAQNFEPRATGFSLTNAYLSMALTTVAHPQLIGMPNFQDTAQERIAYRSRALSILTSRLAIYGSGSGRILRRGWGYTRVTFFRSPLTDTEGFIASNASYTAIVFRGSEVSDLRSILQDWLQTDLNFAPVPVGNGVLPSGFLHAGFTNAALSVRAQILDQLRRFHGYTPRTILRNGRRITIPPTKPIWTMGHSLGGAVAGVSAFLLRRGNNLPVRGTYTGGAPMIGSAGFASLFRSAGLQMNRTVNNCEFVPLAFGELAMLPGDIMLVSQEVANWVAQRFPEPARTPMTILTGSVLQAGRWVNDGIALTTDIAQRANVAYTQFGSLRYFTGDGRMLANPSARTRQDDRVRTYVNGITRVLSRFLLPPLPAPFDLAGWARYPGQLAAAVSRIWNTVTNPGPMLADLQNTYTQWISDHSPVALMHVMHPHLPASVRALTSMPRRP